MRRRLALAGLSAAQLLNGPTAQAYEAEIEQGPFAGWVLDWRNRVSVGVGWRTQKRNDRLIGKATLDPQLCAPDDCISLTASNTEPNERFLAAPGALSSNTDDGDLNYDQWDVVTSGLKFSSLLDFGTVDYGIQLGTLIYYDPVNAYLDQQHPNRVVDEGSFGAGEFVETDRPDETVKQIGYAAELREANLFYFFESWNDQPIEVRLGRQTLTWGEAAINVQGTLNFVNPPDANSLPRPGLELRDIYFPQNMLVVRGPVADQLSFEAFYQLEWRPYGFPARGSFFSFFDGGNDPTPNEYVVGPFGKTPEDPMQLGVPALPLARAVTATSFSLQRAPNNEPDDLGQYGLALYWLLDDWFDRPLSLNFYHANYHSRLPSVSGIAAQAACTRREGNDLGIDANAATLLAVCPIGLQQPGPDTFDALPLETGAYYLDYAEDIKLWGVSFDAEAFKMAVQGEVVFRENQPVQVDLEDVLFTAFQPIFPRNDIDLGLANITGVPGSSLATLAASTRAIPTYLIEYRGGTAGEAVPGSRVVGYERLKTVHGTLGLTKITGVRTPLWAQEGVFLLEFSANWIPDLPELGELQFEGPGTHTHFSPGIAETGDALKINPVSNGANGYVTETAFGYRFAALIRYTDVLIPGLALRPLLILTHDLHGVAPGLAENFLEGRKVIVGNLQLQYDDLRFDLIYSWFTGGGDAHVLRDRDALGISFSYEF